MRRSSSHASRQYWDIPRFLLYADVHSRAHSTSIFRDKIDYNFSTSNLTVGNCLGQAGGRVKMKGSGRDLTSAQSSDHGGERDPATKVRRTRHCR